MDYDTVALAKGMYEEVGGFYKWNDVHPEDKQYWVELAEAALKNMQTLSVQKIADDLSECERDLLLGTGPEGWGAWVTATYEGLLGKGLARRDFGPEGITISFDTPQAKQVIAYLLAREGAPHDKQ